MEIPFLLNKYCCARHKKSDWQRFIWIMTGRSVCDVYKACYGRSNITSVSLNREEITATKIMRSLHLLLIGFLVLFAVLSASPSLRDQDNLPPWIAKWPAEPSCAQRDAMCSIAEHYCPKGCCLPCSSPCSERQLQMKSECGEGKYCDQYCMSETMRK